MEEIKEYLLGGLSNNLELIGPIGNKKIRRVFGKNTNILVNRNDEYLVMKNISDIGLGPKIFENGENERIEEYLEGYKTCISDQIISDGDILTNIFRAYKKIGTIDIPGLKKKSLVIRRLSTWTKAANRIDSSHKEIYTKANNLIITIILTCSNDAIKLCHNDLVAGNIMTNPDKEIKFIDFEYAGYNYPLYDIANFLTELSIDYSGSRFCDKEVCMDKLLPVIYGLVKDDITINGQEISYDNFVKKIRIFTMCCHFLWGVWSVIKSVGMENNFDYKSYANYRFDKFMILYNEYFKN